MSKHTPGPWICQENRTIVSGSPLVTSRHHWIARANNNATLGKTNEDIRKYTEEANANARLIAAAPELLGALKNAAAFYKMILDYEGGCDYAVGICSCKDQRDYQNILDTIAKAEGKS